MVCETSKLDTRSYLFRIVEGESNQGILNQKHTTEMSRGLRSLQYTWNFQNGRTTCNKVILNKVVGCYEIIKQY